MTQRLSPGVLFIFLALVWMGGAATAAEPDGAKEPRRGVATDFSSPEATFRTARAASEAGELETAVSALTDEGRDRLAADMVVAGRLIVVLPAFGDDERAKKKAEFAADIEEVFKKHKLSTEVDPALNPRLGETPQQRQQRVSKTVKPIRDRAQFLEDFLGRMATSGKAIGMPGFLTGAELSDVTVEGDRAEGVMAQEGPRGIRKSRVSFQRVGERWLIADFSPTL